MSSKKDSEAKIDALRRRGVLNRNPQGVTDALFQEDAFFDARDLVQVKYEMLRRVRTEGKTVTEAARAFSTSRFSFYKTQSAFQEEGLPGLVSKKPGPRTRHKITAEVLTFLKDQLGKDPSLHVQELVELVREHFGLTVHRRTIERALGGMKKKTAAIGSYSRSSRDETFSDRYEALRASRNTTLERNLFIHCGMVAWMEAWSSCTEVSDADGKEESRRSMPGEETCGSVRELDGVVHAQVAEILAGIVCAVVRS